MIKTLKDAELRRLVKKGVIMSYYEHLRSNNKSALARIFGVFKIKIKFMHAIPIIVMENIMAERPNEVTAIYDIKGSMFSRISERKKKTTVLKDQNLLQNVEDRMAISPKL